MKLIVQKMMPEKEKENLNNMVKQEHILKTD